MIFVVDDDEVMARCIARAVEKTGKEVQIFHDAINVMNMISDRVMPEMIFLDILLTGPDGFTLLNEMVSYTDTGMIPIVVVSSLDFGGMDLAKYGVVGVLNKDSMKPEEIMSYARQNA